MQLDLDLNLYFYLLIYLFLVSFLLLLLLFVFLLFSFLAGPEPWVQCRGLMTQSTWNTRRLVATNKQLAKTFILFLNASENDQSSWKAKTLTAVTQPSWYRLRSLIQTTAFVKLEGKMNSFVNINNEHYYLVFIVSNDTEAVTRGQLERQIWLLKCKALNCILMFVYTDFQKSRTCLGILHSLFTWGFWDNVSNL